MKTLFWCSMWRANIVKIGSPTWTDWGYPKSWATRNDKKRRKRKAHLNSDCKNCTRHSPDQLDEQPQEMTQPFAHLQWRRSRWCELGANSFASIESTNLECSIANLSSHMTPFWSFYIGEKRCLFFFGGVVPLKNQQTWAEISMVRMTFKSLIVDFPGSSFMFCHLAWHFPTLTEHCIFSLFFKTTHGKCSWPQVTLSRKP